MFRRAKKSFLAGSLGSLAILLAFVLSAPALATCESGRIDLVGDFEFNFGSDIKRVVQTLEAAKSLRLQDGVSVADAFKVENLEQTRPGVFGSFSVCEGSKLIIHGDISKVGSIHGKSLEHGQQVLLLFELLVDLKNRFPEQVVLLVGNNDDLFPSEYVRPSGAADVGFADAMPDEDSFWAGMFGFGSTSVSTDEPEELSPEEEAEMQVIDDLNARYREARSAYANSAQLMFYDPDSGLLSMHGGIPPIGAGIISLENGIVGLTEGIKALRSTGKVPDYLRRAANVESWVDWMNTSYREAMQSSDPEVQSAVERFTSLGAANFSAVTARPTEKAALVDLAAGAAEYLGQGGVKVISYAHTPAGDMPAMGIDPSGIAQVMLDLSESKTTPLVMGAHISSQQTLVTEGFVSNQFVKSEVDLSNPVERSGQFIGRVFRPNERSAGPSAAAYYRIIGEVQDSETQSYLAWTVTPNFKNEYRVVSEADLSRNYQLIQDNGGLSREAVKKMFPPRPAHHQSRAAGGPKGKIGQKPGRPVKKGPGSCKNSLKN